MQPSSVVRRTNIPAIVVGVFAVITTLFGIYYNAVSILAAVRGRFEPVDDVPYFYAAFYTMSGICVLCYVCLLVCGIDLVRSRLRWWRLVALILIFEVVYFFMVGWLWLEPTIGRSVAAATGVANGGLMAQFAILLPLWAPILLWWAKSRHVSLAT